MTTDTTKRGFVEVAGHKIAFTRTGCGPSIVLIHGIPTNGYLWRHVIPPLAARWSVVTLDLLGYGASDKPPGADLRIAAQTRLVVEVLHQLGVQVTAIVGHDIGGGIAQLIAVEHSSLVDRLILVDSITYDSFPEPGIARLKDPVWDGILGTPDFDLKKGLTKGFTRGMVPRGTDHARTHRGL